MSASYPLLLDLAGRRVVVVGGGRVAARRTPALLEAGADVVVISPSAHPAIAALAAEGRLSWLQRAYREGDVEGCWLVHVCSDEVDVNHSVSAEAERRQVLCVRADDRGAATAWVPAVARHGDVIVAVNAGGAPARARALRDQVSETLFADPRERHPAAAHETGPSPGSAKSASGAAGTVAGRVALVGAGPGDPGLLTVRARELLEQADVVLVDRLVDRAILAHVKPTTSVIDVGKRGWATSAGQQQAEIERLLVEHARTGSHVVRLKGGDPFVFGRGGEEALACVEAGIPFEVVPGVTSATSVPAYAGVPVTMRGATQDVALVSGHLDPDDAASTVRWRSHAEGPGTLVILMGLSALPAICAALIEYGRPPDTPAACIARGTTPRQQTVVATLDRLAAEVEHARLPSPAITVVGDVVRLRDRLRWFAEDPEGPAT